MQEYDIIKRARAALADQPASPSERTVAGYVARARRIMEQAGKGAEIADLIAEAKRTRSASTWFTRRAALAFMFRRGIEGLLTEQDRAQRALKAGGTSVDSPAWDSWRTMIGQLRKLVDWHETLQREPGPPHDARRPRHSKRKDLRGLPDDWREKLVARMPAYRLAVLTEAVTGCRPAELVNGVQLEIQGEHLVATIQGVKVTALSGQPWRRLAWPVNSPSPLVQQLVEEVRAGAVLAKIEDAKRYSSAVRAAGGREWPRRRASMSPYCFRHAFASDMKASGMDDATISQALGHCADVARRYYGTWQQGSAGGGVAPKSVAAARAVKIAQESKYIPSRLQNRHQT